MDCSRASLAERTCEPWESPQCPNDRNPIFFTQLSTTLYAAGESVDQNFQDAGTKRSLATLRPIVLAGQILGPLLGEFATAQSRGLTDFDQVAVGVPHIAANLSTAIDRRRHKLGPF